MQCCNDYVYCEQDVLLSLCIHAWIDIKHLHSYYSLLYCTFCFDYWLGERKAAGL